MFCTLCDPSGWDSALLIASLSGRWEFRRREKGLASLCLRSVLCLSNCTIPLRGASGSWGSPSQDQILALEVSSSNLGCKNPNFYSSFLRPRTIASCHYYHYITLVSLCACLVFNTCFNNSQTVSVRITNVAAIFLFDPDWCLFPLGSPWTYI